MTLNGTSEVRRVLIVEDEPLLALDLQDMLAELGYLVIGTATRIERAIALAEGSEFELAILDINLAGSNSFPVADILRKRQKPFIFTTGYGADGLRDGYRGTPLLTKPFGLRELERVVFRALTEPESD